MQGDSEGSGARCLGGGVVGGGVDAGQAIGRAAAGR